MKKSKFFAFMLIFAFIVIILDQTSKFIVNITIDYGFSRVIIPNFFSITNARNFGAAWSILWDQKTFIIVITMLALLLIIFLIFREKENTKLKSVYYGLLIGGIIGNLIDRVFLGYVVDFLDFTFFGYNYPIFNISDIAIVTSVLLICVECFFVKEEKKSQDIDELEVLDFDE